MDNIIKKTTQIKVNICASHIEMNQNTCDKLLKSIENKEPINKVSYIHAMNGLKIILNDELNDYVTKIVYSNGDSNLISICEPEVLVMNKKPFENEYECKWI